MGDLLDQIVKLGKPKKVGLVALAFGLTGVVYYFLFYSELQERRENLESQYGQLLQEQADYEKKKVEYVSFKNEVVALREKQQDLLKKLPKKSEIPSFLESIHAQAELAGLDIVSFQRDEEMGEDLYVKIPVKMRLAGNYHQVARFFRAVGELKRIVNIEDLHLALAEGKKASSGLSANFLASTFRFIERGEKK